MQRRGRAYGTGEGDGAEGQDGAGAGWRAGRAALALGLCLVPLAPAAAQDVVPGAGGRRSARATRVDVPPVIDGRLDDPAWARATPIGELWQVEPGEGVPPSEASDVRVVYDDEAVYFGMRFFDRRPERIVVKTMERDGLLDAEDYAMLVLDTHKDRRNAFFFQIGAAGSMGDALVTNSGADFNKPWDGIWDARTTIDELGWTAELAIPFETLSFRRDETTWGFNLERVIARTNERARWASPDRDDGLFELYEAGDLEGVEGAHGGLGLDLKPFFVGTWSSDDDQDDTDAQGQPGLDAFYRITPSLLFSLTVNTDFAETEVDERRVNLTRFPLFFPEQRDFFLQDAGLFDFADLGNDLIPFFSRTIGLSPGGEEVPLSAGAKLTGRAGPYSVGALGVITDDAQGLDEQELAVARVQRNVGEESTLGGIVTAGDPAGGEDAATFGLDWNLRATRALGGRDLRSSWWVLGTTAEEETSQGLAYGASLGSPSDLWSWSLSARQIDEDFDPALGFVPRRGIRDYAARTQLRPRIDEDVRYLEFVAAGEVVTDTDDDVETIALELQPIGVELDSGDGARLELVHSREVLDEPFDIADDVTIPAEDYSFTRYRLEAESAEQRELSGFATFTTGEFFDGDRDDFTTGLAWSPGPRFTGTASYERNDVELPDGDFVVNVARLRTDVSFTPRVAWRSILQWDDRSERFGIFSRVRWIFQPGNELYVVFNQSLVDADAGLRSEFEELAFKVVWTLRF